MVMAHMTRATRIPRMIQVEVDIGWFPLCLAGKSNGRISRRCPVSLADRASPYVPQNRGVPNAPTIESLQAPRWTVAQANANRPRSRPRWRPKAMSDLSVTILPETTDDALAIERLHERTFGPGRYARTAYRLREAVPHRLELSFTARIGTLLVGSVRLSHIRIGATPALLLGPLTVEPPFRSRGIGRELIERAVKEARNKHYRLVILIGDEPYYG